LNEECGVLYDPSSEDGLRTAMGTVQRRHFDEAQIEAYAASLQWERSAATVIAALKEVH
jgi:hypothetical protein